MNKSCSACVGIRRAFRESAIRALAACAVAICLSEPVRAHPVQRLSQFGHSVWRTQDGLFSTPNAIAQTKDGYLWIGTDRGLLRFDGVRFVPANEVTGFPTSEFRVSTLLGSSDGGLWVGNGPLIANIQNGRVTRYVSQHRPVQFVEDTDGSAWVVQIRGAAGEPVCHLVKGKVQCYGPPSVPMQYGASIIGNSKEGFWIGSSSGLCNWYPGRDAAECHLQKRQQAFEGLEGVSSILRLRDGRLLVGIGRAGPGLGLGVLTDGIWKNFEAENLDGSQISVSALVEDVEGGIWIGTYDEGIYRVAQGRVDHYRSEDGLSSNDVNKTGILEDREGNVWVMTASGIDVFRHQRVSTYSIRQGLRSDMVESVLARRNGDVWLGNKWLSIIRDGINVPPDHPEIFGDRPVTSLLEDRRGDVWIGLDKTLQIYRDEKLSEVPGSNGKALGIVTNLVEDGNGDIWASTSDHHRLYRIHDGKVVAELDPKGFEDPRIAIASDPRGALWLGSKHGSLASYKDEELKFLPQELVNGADIRHLFVDADSTLFAATTGGLLVRGRKGTGFLTVKEGLPCDNLSAVIRDQRDGIWLNATCGLIEIDIAELERWLGNQGESLHASLLDSTDGVESGFGSFGPRASVGPDGRVWFATAKFAEVVDVMDEKAASAPPVKIEELKADRTVYSLADTVRLPPASRDISIRYTALSFATPQKIMFQYMLEGRDGAWQDVGTRREAFYTDLRPGSYVFHVRASNRNGLFGNAEATLGFDVPPFFYQTRWFGLGCALAALFSLYGLFLMRLRQVAGRVRQQMRVKSRERERIARDLHDTLLQDTQALVLKFQRVAEEIPADSPARKIMDDTLDQADQILADGRETVLGLRGPDAGSENLPAALSREGDELARSGTCGFRMVIDGQPRRLRSELLEPAYRIGREALLNAFHHAHAANVEVEISYKTRAFVLQVRDDGLGIDPAILAAGMKTGHFGLLGMRERATELGGKLEVRMGRKSGTEVHFEMPAELAYASTGKPRISWLRNLGITTRWPAIHGHDQSR